MFKPILVTRQIFTTFIAANIAVLGTVSSTSAIAEDSCSKCNELKTTVKTWENSLSVYKKNLEDNNKLLEKIKSSEKLKNKRNSAEEGQIRLNIINATALIETANNTLEKAQQDIKGLKCNECTQSKQNNSTPQLLKASPTPALNPQQSSKNSTK